jgi:hypothetical protein
MIYALVVTHVPSLAEPLRCSIEWWMHSNVFVLIADKAAGDHNHGLSPAQFIGMALRWRQSSLDIVVGVAHGLML